MGLLAKSRKSKRLVCPACASGHVRIAYIDRVGMTVAHGCYVCDHQWREQLIDLTDVPQLVAGRR